MKVVIINTWERVGGAAIAANRLMNALDGSGIGVSMLVRDKQTHDSRVAAINTSWLKKKVNFLRFVWERLIIYLNNKQNRTSAFQVSIANTGTDISNHPLVREADIIHLHWINQGFLSLKDIKKLTQLGKPVVWTMHDMWAFTGICHHSYGCLRYQSSCGHCPFLKSNCQNDLSYQIIENKRFISKSDIRLVAVSSWLKWHAQGSSLTKDLQVSVIPNVINTKIFRSSDKKTAREWLQLPQEASIVVMGAARLDDPIKGFQYLNDALKQVQLKTKNLFLVIFGLVRLENNFFKEINVPYKYFGRLTEQLQIASIYSAADVTVVPSLYETFGQTLIESMACGCPSVSFDNSGQTDIVDHHLNGYLARYKDVEDLAKGIEWVLNNKDSLNLQDECIKKVQSCYTEQVVASKYISLYEKLLAR